MVSAGIAIAGLALVTHPLAAAAADTSDWPCVQARTRVISGAAIWSGPDPAAAGAWDKDFDAAALAQKLASRRTPLEEVDALLEAFAAKAGADKTTRLTRVFAGVLEIVNGERDRVISGLVRYAKGQQRLAEKVRSESEAVGDFQESANSTSSKAREEVESSLKWDKRIFEERSRSLTYVCETPGLLEKRAFEIARRIQQRL